MYYKGDALDDLRETVACAIRGHALGRVANQMKREALRLPGLRVLHGYAHLEALEEHSTRIPLLDPRDLPILEGLRIVGVHAVPIESLGLPETPGVLGALRKLVADLRESPPEGESAPRLPIKRLMDVPAIYLWGLNERLLSLVENHIGLPVRYHGADLRREVADGTRNDVRQWHIDAEDHRMFKVIVYLNEVRSGGGPFEYIGRQRTVEVARRLGYSSGFVSDAELGRVLHSSDPVAVTASSHTAVFADTCRVFHRAQPPLATDRYSITYSWTSTTPVKSYPTMPIPDDTYAFIMSRLTERQRAAVPPRGR